MLRSLSLQLRGEPETQLPLTREEDLIKTDDVLDLSELAILSCTSGPGGTGSALLRHQLWCGSMRSMQSELPLTQDHAEGHCWAAEDPVRVGLTDMRTALAFLVLWIKGFCLSPVEKSFS